MTWRLRPDPRNVSVPRSLRLIAALLLATAHAAPALAARVVVFGDSWGVPAAPALQAVFDAEGVNETVAGAATGGETAANLSSAPGLQHISNTLAANPDADLVHLSIGGNDFLGQWNASLTPAQEDALFQAIIADVETIVEHILAVRPGALVFWSSYDYPRPLPLGTPAEVNAAGGRFAVLAFALADAKGAGLTYGDFTGLMQVTYGFDGTQPTIYDPPFPIPPGDPSLPDPMWPSPAASFSDSIHLTAEGYLVLAEAHYDAFYAALLAVPVPASSVVSRGALAALILLGAASTLRQRVSRPRRARRRGGSGLRRD
jgi:lysophospholipase L1-like esterase